MSVGIYLLQPNEGLWKTEENESDSGCLRRSLRGIMVFRSRATNTVLEQAELLAAEWA